MVEETAVLTPTITDEAGRQTINPEWAKDRQERKAAALAGKPMEARPTPAQPKAEEPKADDKHEDEERKGNGMSAGARREFNRLQREIGELRGRNQVLQELIDKGFTPKQAEAKVAAAEEKADGEPQRKDFAEGAAGDLEFTRAIAKHAGKTEAEKGFAEKEQSESLKRDIEMAAAIAAKERTELFPDWDDVAKAGAKSEDAPVWQDFPKGDARHKEGVPVRPIFSLMLAKSPLQARFAYHFTKNPDALEGMLAHPDGSNEQILAFEKLAGRLEVLYDAKKKEQEVEKPKVSAESTAKLHRPSQSIAPKVGSAAEPDIPMTIQNDRGQQVINPAWSAARNLKAGRRA